MDECEGGGDGGGLSPGKSGDGFGNVSFCPPDLQMEMSQWLITYGSGAWREGQGSTEIGLILKPEDWMGESELWTEAGSWAAHVQLARGRAGAASVTGGN